MVLFSSVDSTVFALPGTMVWHDTMWVSSPSTSAAENCEEPAKISVVVHVKYIDKPIVWSCIVLLWLEPPLANDFCNFLNKIAKIMKVFVEVDLLKGYQPLCQR